MIARVLFHSARMALAMLLATSAMAAVEAIEAPRVLVATTGDAAESEGAVILAVPLGNGGHFGIILNQPTETPLAELFPDEEASQRVKAPVYVGGPTFGTALFAIVRENGKAEPRGNRVTPDLSIVLNVDDVNHVIEARPADARFYLGLVVWNPGELAGQLSEGAWRVMPAEAEVVLSARPDRLWKSLTPPFGTRYTQHAPKAGPAVGHGPVPARPDPARFPRGYRLRHG